MPGRPRQLTLDIGPCGVFPDELDLVVTLCAGESGDRHLHWEARAKGSTLIGMRTYDGPFTAASTVAAIWDEASAWHGTP